MEAAKPGAATSGLSTSPPLDENEKSSSCPRTVPYRSFAEVRFMTAATERTVLAQAGMPMLESPGPSFPAETVATTWGYSSRSSSIRRSASPVPSFSDPVP